ncbi:MAG TPA: hypothetical protein VFJ91_08540 [Gaiellaceae bacterium]|nr:hypothetical protein [Gaiellaceae bacterium]
MGRRLALLAVAAAAAALPAAGGAGNPSLTRLRIGDAVDVLGTRIACFAITSNSKDGIACLLWKGGKVLPSSFGVGLAVDGTAVVNRIDAKGNSTKVWKKRLPASRGAASGKVYKIGVGGGFGIPVSSEVVLGCEVLNVTSTAVEPLYRGVKVSCWPATATKAVPNRYGVSISDRFAGVFKITPQGSMSTWGYVKRQPAP